MHRYKCKSRSMEIGECDLGLGLKRPSPTPPPPPPPIRGIDDAWKESRPVEVTVNIENKKQNNDDVELTPKEILQIKEFLRNLFKDGEE